MDERIRALIVDDERSSRRAIAVQLEAMDTVEVVGEAANGRAAVELTRKTRPDLVFLDVQMPGMDGFGVIEELGPNALPHIVFVTGHDEFALKAFEVNAVDYLLKPVDDRRLERAVDRVRRQADPQRALGDSGVRRLLEHTVGGRPPGPHKARLLVKEQQAYMFVPVEEIEWIGAEGNYARLHADGGDYLVRSSLTDLDEDLDPSVFLRIHRSAIVNLNRVRSIQPHGGSDYQVVLGSGRHVRVGRTYRDALLQRE